MEETIGRQPNTLVLPSDVEQYVVLVGGEDQPLVEAVVSEYVDRCQLIVHSRGFFTYRCKSRAPSNIPFTLAITGIGPSATEIAVTEYANCGAQVFIRAGTSGALLPTLRLGSLVITREALRYDGLSDWYVTESSQKAVAADEDVTQALINSANKLKMDYVLGVTLTTCGYYAMGGISKSGKLAFGGYGIKTDFQPVSLRELLDLQAKNSVHNVEMETATLLALSRAYGLKSGAVCGISNRIPWVEDEQITFTEASLGRAMSVAIGAFDYLCRRSSL